jgi:hypothetical protein
MGSARLAAPLGAGRLAGGVLFERVLRLDGHTGAVLAGGGAPRGDVHPYFAAMIIRSCCFPS